MSQQIVIIPLEFVVLTPRSIVEKVLVHGLGGNSVTWIAILLMGFPLVPFNTVTKRLPSAKTSQVVLYVGELVGETCEPWNPG